MRSLQFTNNNYYLISGTGAKGYELFQSETDGMRFVLSILANQSSTPLYNTHWYFYMLTKRGTLPLGPAKQKDILKRRYIELLGFCLWKNEYHLVIKTLADHIPSVYMHRTLTSYAKYTNSKHNTRGHVFEGPYKAEKLKGLKEVVEKLLEIHSIPYFDESATAKTQMHMLSSLPDYLEKNRWGEFLETKTLSKYFKNISEHRDALAKHIKSKKALY